MKRSLVLGGGGSYGIGWQSGILVGLAEAGFDAREVDFILGTSAGSQVGAVVASSLAWEEIWARQVDPLLENHYLPSPVEAATLLQLYAQIRNQAKSPQEWILGLGALSAAMTVSEAQRLREVAQRLQLSTWPSRLGVVGVDIQSGGRVLWTRESCVDLIRAVAASSALPAAYPAVAIGERLYCDGGVYSMENADLAASYQKVLILSVGLPIPTPYTLDDQVALLRRSGAEVEVIQPDQNVLSVLRHAGGNAVDPLLRAPVAKAARLQALSIAEKLSWFWND